MMKVSWRPPMKGVRTKMKRGDQMRGMLTMKWIPMKVMIKIFEVITF